MQTSLQFVKLLKADMRKVFDESKYDEMKPMIPALYNVISGDSAIEEWYQTGTLGNIPAFNGSLTELTISPGYYNKIEPKEYAAKVSFERKLLDDKKYGVMSNRVAMLSRASTRTIESFGARPFQNAFSSAFDYQTSEEGVALCSTAHTTKSGTSTTTGFSNSGTSAFSKTSVAATRINFKKFRDDRSNMISTNPDTLVVPTNLYDTACEIVGYDPRSGASSALDPDSGNNKINAQRGYKVIEYSLLDDTDTNNWFMVDSAKMKQWLVFINRIKPEYNMNVDFNTFVIENSVYFRVANGFLDWRWIYGQNAS